MDWHLRSALFSDSGCILAATFEYVTAWLPVDLSIKDKLALGVLFEGNRGYRVTIQLEIFHGSWLVTRHSRCRRWENEMRQVFFYAVCPVSGYSIADGECAEMAYCLRYTLDDGICILDIVEFSEPLQVVGRNVSGSAPRSSRAGPLPCPTSVRLQRYFP